MKTLRRNKKQLSNKYLRKYIHTEVGDLLAEFMDNPGIYSGEEYHISNRDIRAAMGSTITNQFMYGPCGLPYERPIESIKVDDYFPSPVHQSFYNSDHIED